MSKLPYITSAMLTVTHRCNLRCRYCFVRQGPQDMTLDTAIAAAEFLIRNAKSSNSIPEINFFGGEPLLMFDEIIKPLVEWAHNARGEKFKFSITTNGTLLTDSRIQFMRKHGFGVLFSMDGIKPMQDYNRPDAAGNGTFARLKEVVPKIILAWPNTTFRMTALPETCRYVYDSVLWAVAQGFKGFFVVPDVFREWPQESREALKREVGKYAAYYFKSKAKNEKPILFSSFEQALLDIGLIRAANEAGEFRASPKCKSSGKCGLGASRFAAIHPDGSLYACQEMTSNDGAESAFYIGNIFDGVDDDRRRALMAEYDSAPARGDSCETCPYNRICDGGCVANNYLITGKLNLLPEVYCWWKRTLLEAAGGERDGGLHDKL